MNAIQVQGGEARISRNMVSALQAVGAKRDVRIRRRTTLRHR